MTEHNLDSSDAEASQLREVRHEHSVSIIVEGVRYEVTGERITFEDVVALRYDGNPPTGPNVILTVTYSKGVHNASGTLAPGRAVDIKSHMVFNVADATQS